MNDDSTTKSQHEFRELEQANMIMNVILKKLEKREKISKEVFDSLSHEIRTPMVTIKGYTDMLIDGKFGKLEPIQKEKLLQIKSSTDLLLHILFKILEKKNID